MANSTKTCDSRSIGDWAETAEGVQKYDIWMQAAAPTLAAILEKFNDAFLHPSEPPVYRDDDGRQRHQCLDIGCGPGSFTLKYLLPSLPPWCQRLVAVDNAPEMIAFAREKYAHPKIEHQMLDLAVDDQVAKFVLEQGRFQRVYSFSTLHWIADQQRAMCNIESLMAAGGECFVVFLSTIIMFDVYEALLQSPRWQKYSDLLKSFLPPTGAMDQVSLRSHAVSLVRAANLCPLACEVFHTPTVKIRNAKEEADYLTSSNIIYRLLENDEKAELGKFIYDFLDGISKKTFVQKPRHILVIHAYKPYN